MVYYMTIFPIYLTIRMSIQRWADFKLKRTFKRTGGFKRTRGFKRTGTEEKVKSLYSLNQILLRVQGPLLKLLNNGEWQEGARGQY